MICMRIMISLEYTFLRIFLGCEQFPIHFDDKTIYSVYFFLESIFNTFLSIIKITLRSKT